MGAASSPARARSASAPAPVRAALRSLRPAAALSVALGVLVAVIVGAAGCNPPPAAGALSRPSKHKLTSSYAAAPFTEQQLADDWRVTSGTWTIVDGRLRGRQLDRDLEGLDPKPLPFALIWLAKPLPHEFRISYKAEGMRDPRDINAIFCGDGIDLSGYDLVLGGWTNTKHQLSWYQEAHKFGSRDALDKVKPGMLRPKPYEITIERSEQHGIVVYLDNEKVMSDRDDPKIAGDDMRYFALYTWDNDVAFWDLKIEPYPHAQQRP